MPLTSEPGVAALNRRAFTLGVVAALSACSTPPQPPTPPLPPGPPPKLALALGGGAARGFAHIGVIKVLEARGVRPDLIVGTSAGSVVGALYASGLDAFSLQQVALAMHEESLLDWGFPVRGVFKGEALQDFVNQGVKNRLIEQLAIPFGALATDLLSGRRVLFQRGNTGQAVRASSAVPGVFKPVLIAGREYVDGGLTEPVPVRAARDMGGDVVIAVDISQKPQAGRVDGTLAVLLQTVTIMGEALSQSQLSAADIVIRPHVAGLTATDFGDRTQAILEGEKAATRDWPKIEAMLRAKRVLV